VRLSWPRCDGKEKRRERRRDSWPRYLGKKEEKEERLLASLSRERGERRGGETLGLVITEEEERGGG